MVAIEPLLSSARTVKSSSSARPGTIDFMRAWSRRAWSPATKRTNWYACVPMSPPQPYAPALAGSTRQVACLCPSSSRRVASQPWGYHASTLRISPISPCATSSRASMTIG